MDAEVLTLVHPRLLQAPPGRSGQISKLADGVFVGVLRVDALAFLEEEAGSADFDFLRNQAHEMHLDAAVAAIVDGLMPEVLEIEAGFDFPIDAIEKIEIEGGRHAGCVIVGGDQNGRVLLQVDPDDETAGR